MVYEWKFRQPVPAQKAGEYLNKLEKENGKLTAQLVLDESRDENALLHPCFEWDDAKAAEGYRLQQAGFIIRNITVKLETSAGKKEPVRAFVNIGEKEQFKNKGEFVTFEIAMQNEEYRQRVLKYALDELKTFRTKYSTYKELSNIFKAIEETETKISA